MFGSTHDLVILIDETINAYHKSGLEATGWKLRQFKGSEIQKLKTMHTINEITTNLDYGN